MTNKTQIIRVRFDTSNSPDSPNALNASLAVCRICHSSERSCPYTTRGEPLISPCLCKGTMGLYHRTCISHWLETSKTRFCEICKFAFQLKRLKRGFRSYLKHKDAITERKNLVTDLICFFILTPLALVAAGLCLYGSISHFTNTGIEFSNNEYLEPPSAEVAICLLILTILLMVTYLVWFIITFVYHYRMFRLWQDSHMDRFHSTPIPMRANFNTSMSSLQRPQVNRVQASAPPFESFTSS